MALDPIALSQLLKDFSSSSTPLSTSNTLVLVAHPAVPEAVLSWVSQHPMLEDLRHPCCTGGRRAAEFLLAAASNRITWHQILTGAFVTSHNKAAAVLTSADNPATCGHLCSSLVRQHAVPCNKCAAEEPGSCGTDAAKGCWRLDGGTDGCRRQWLSHGQVDALHLGNEDNSRQLDPVVRAALLAVDARVGPDTVNANSVLRNADRAGPLFKLCQPQTENHATQLFAVASAGVQSLVQIWSGFERDWREEWTKIRAAMPLATLFDKTRQLDAPVEQWTGKQRAHVRRHVAKADRFALHVLLLQLPMATGWGPRAWLDGRPLLLPPDRAAWPSPVSVPAPLHPSAAATSQVTGQAHAVTGQTVSDVSIGRGQKRPRPHSAVSCGRADRQEKAPEVAPAIRPRATLPSKNTSGTGGTIRSFVTASMFHDNRALSASPRLDSQAATHDLSQEKATSGATRIQEGPVETQPLHLSAATLKFSPQQEARVQADSAASKEIPWRNPNTGMSQQQQEVGAQPYNSFQWQQHQRQLQQQQQQQARGHQQLQILQAMVTAQQAQVQAIIQGGQMTAGPQESQAQRCAVSELEQLRIMQMQLGAMVTLRQLRNQQQALGHQQQPPPCHPEVQASAGMPHFRHHMMHVEPLLSMSENTLQRRSAPGDTRNIADVVPEAIPRPSVPRLSLPHLPMVDHLPQQARGQQPPQMAEPVPERAREHELLPIVDLPPQQLMQPQPQGSFAEVQQLIRLSRGLPLVDGGPIPPPNIITAATDQLQVRLVKERPHLPLSKSDPPSHAHHHLQQHAQQQQSRSQLHQLQHQPQLAPPERTLPVRLQPNVLSSNQIACKFADSLPDLGLPEELAAAVVKAATAAAFDIVSQKAAEEAASEHDPESRHQETRRRQQREHLQQGKEAGPISSSDSDSQQQQAGEQQLQPQYGSKQQQHQQSSNSPGPNPRLQQAGGHTQQQNPPRRRPRVSNVLRRVIVPTIPAGAKFTPDEDAARQLIELAVAPRCHVSRGPAVNESQQKEQPGAKKRGNGATPLTWPKACRTARTQAGRSLSPTQQVQQGKAKRHRQQLAGGISSSVSHSSEQTSPKNGKVDPNNSSRREGNDMGGSSGSPSPIEKASTEEEALACPLLLQPIDTPVVPPLVFRSLPVVLPALVPKPPRGTVNVTSLQVNNTSKQGGSSCSNPECCTTQSTKWRKGPPSMPLLCNACGMRWCRSRRLNVTKEASPRAATAISSEAIDRDTFDLNAPITHSNASRPGVHGAASAHTAEGEVIDPGETSPGVGAACDADGGACTTSGLPSGGGSSEPLMSTSSTDDGSSTSSGSSDEWIPQPTDDDSMPRSARKTPRKHSVARLSMEALKGGRVLRPLSNLSDMASPAQSCSQSPLPLIPFQLLPSQHQQLHTRKRPASDMSDRESDGPTDSTSCQKRHTASPADQISLPEGGSDTAGTQSSLGGSDGGSNTPGMQLLQGRSLSPGHHNGASRAVTAAPPIIGQRTQTEPAVAHSPVTRPIVEQPTAMQSTQAYPLAADLLTSVRSSFEAVSAPWNDVPARATTLPIPTSAKTLLIANERLAAMSDQAMWRLITNGVANVTDKAQATRALGEQSKGTLQPVTATMWHVNTHMTPSLVKHPAGILQHPAGTLKAGSAVPPQFKNGWIMADGAAIASGCQTVIQDGQQAETSMQLTNSGNELPANARQTAQNETSDGVQVLAHRVNSASGASQPHDVTACHPGQLAPISTSVQPLGVKTTPHPQRAASRGAWPPAEVNPCLQRETHEARGSASPSIPTDSCPGMHSRDTLSPLVLPQRTLSSFGSISSREGSPDDEPAKSLSPRCMLSQAEGLLAMARESGFLPLRSPTPDSSTPLFRPGVLLHPPTGQEALPAAAQQTVHLQHMPPTAERSRDPSLTLSDSDGSPSAATASCSDDVVLPSSAPLGSTTMLSDRMSHEVRPAKWRL